MFFSYFHPFPFCGRSDSCIVCLTSQYLYHCLFENVGVVVPVILLQVVFIVTFAALLAVVPSQAWYLRALAILTGTGIRRESRLGSRLYHSLRIRICVLLPCGCMLHHCTRGSPTYSTRVCHLSVSLGQVSGCSLARFLILTRLQSRCWWGLHPQLRPLHPLLGSLSWYVCWQNSLPCSCVAEALGSVAINEDQMGTRKGHLFRAFNSKGVGHHYLHLAGTQRQVEGRESLTMEQRGSFRSGVPRLGSLDWGDWMQLTSCGWLGSLLASAWSHIGNQDKIRRLSVINQVLIVLSKGVLTFSPFVQHKFWAFWISGYRGHGFASWTSG